MKKILALFLSVALCVTALSACGNKKKSTKKKPDSSSSSLASGSEAEKDLQGVNFLTGEPLEFVNNNRPVAIMINNIKTALPQYGIGAADIIYEVPVEGGITRMMAVYNDYTKVPRVCSIRSCRYYYPVIALGMDAVYVHWGMDPSIAKETLNRLGINRLDGSTIGSQYFGRDQARLKKYSLEHTGYFDGTRLPEAMKKLNYRTNRDSSYGKTLFNFSSSPLTLTGATCNSAVLTYSSLYFSTFTYNTTNHTYTKMHSGKPHMDSSTGKQLEFKNVLVLQTNIKNFNNSKLMDVELKGGTGKYISNGVAIDIKWSKENEKSKIVLTKADGAKLELNQGKTYIGIIGYNKSVSIK